MTLAIREKALQLQNVLKEASQTTQLFDTNKLLRQLTLDTTQEIVFGSKLNLLTSGKEHPFEIAFDAANHITGKRLSTPAWVWKPMRWLNIISERRLREAIGEMDEFIVNLIMEAMEHIRATEAGNQVASKNIMTILLSSEQDIAPTLVRDWEIKEKFIHDDKFKSVIASDLQLYLAKTEGGAWLSDEDSAALDLEKGMTHADIHKMMDSGQMRASKTLQFLLFEKNKMPQLSADQIHVLVVVPPHERHDSAKEERAVKKVKTIGTEIKDEKMMAVAATLDLETWDVGGVALNVCNVEPDFPQWLYVRKETLDIIQIFKDHIKKGLNTVFVGTPGVGKSTLVVLFALYMALCQQKRIILFRKVKGKGSSVLYMDASNRRYWRKERAELSDLDLVNGEGFELILDGFTQEDVKNNFGRLTRFRLLATSQQYLMKNDDVLL
ncbi:hypothetical protein PInf_010305 [Phytophthora infestans]|nr:hypothetical protein PInf_010305 [Phytophthora infestans]